MLNSINSKMHANEGVEGGVQGNRGTGDECFSPDKGVYIPLQSEMQSVRGGKGDFIGNGTIDNDILKMPI